DEVRVPLQYREEGKERAEEEHRRSDDERALLAHGPRKAREKKLEAARHPARGARAVEEMVAPERELVQPVDELGAVLAVAREREVLADASVGLRNLRIRE